jgi:hypothetical protein
MSDPIGLVGGLNTYVYAMNDPLFWIDPTGLEVTGEWIKKPFPEVYDFHIVWGDARRPDDWWKIWKNGLNYKPIEHRVDVHAGIQWEVKCTDDQECGSESWEISGGYADWIGVYVPISSPIHPRLGRFTGLWNITQQLLIDPARSKALQEAASWAEAFYDSNSAKDICLIYPRP